MNLQRLWRSTATLGFILLAVLGGAECGGAQATDLIFQRILKARDLAGIVHLPNDRSAVLAVTVEERTADWKTVFCTTQTDENGRFKLCDASRRGIRYLRVGKPNLNASFYTVHITHWARRKELALILQVAM